MLIPVVIAGGIGSRLWPVSRTLLPKQFIHFQQFGGSLFQNTLNRLNGIEDISQPLVVCNEEHRFLVAEQLRTLGELDSKILLETFKPVTNFGVRSNRQFIKPSSKRK